MPDLFNVTFELGGKIPNKTLSELAKCLHESGLGIDYSGASIDDILDELREANTNKESCLFSDPENSRTTELDQFCVSNQICFIKRLEGKYEFESEISWFDPKFGQIQEWCPCNKSASEPLMSITLLEEALKDGQTLQDVITYIKTMIPDVPPIEIIE